MGKDERRADNPFQRLWRNLGLGSGEKGWSPFADAEALTERRALLARIAAFLVEHDLPITPFTLVTAHDCVTRENARLAGLVVDRVAKGLPLDLGWLEQALRSPAQDRASELMVDLLRHLRESIAAFDRTTTDALRASDDFTGAIKTQLAEIEQAGADSAMVRNLADVTEAMLGEASRLHAELAESRQRTDELQSTLAEVQRVADEDHLTGLANRRAFEHRFGQALHHANEAREALCLGVVDIDHFKRVNDSHGHAAGDRVLKVVADMLDGLSDAGCFVARLGGEEFGILFPAREPAQAFTLLDAARIEMAERRLVNRTNDRPFGMISFSGGIADVIASGDLTQAFRAADRALYVAKAAGRNRVVLADQAWSLAV